MKKIKQNADKIEKLVLEIEDQKEIKKVLDILARLQGKAIKKAIRISALKSSSSSF